MGVTFPDYDNDCECLEICKKLNSTYDRCYKGASTILHDRCSKPQRQMILQNNSLSKKSVVWIILSGIGGIAVGALGTLLGQYLINTFLSR